MIPLKDKVNVNAPVGTYPFGAQPFGTLRNNPGDASGTPVDVDLVQDIMIFAEAMMASGGVVPNGILDVGAAPQLLLALGNVINAAITNRPASEIARGIAEIATQTETNAGTDDERYITALKLAGWFTNKFSAWTKDTTTSNWSFAGGSGTVSFNSQNVSYKIVGKTITVNYGINFDVVTGTVFLIRYTFPVNRLGLQQVIKPIFIVQGSVQKFARVNVNADSAFTMVQQFDVDGTTSFPVGTGYLLQGEFTVEIL